MYVCTWSPFAPGRRVAEQTASQGGRKGSGAGGIRTAGKQLPWPLSQFAVVCMLPIINHPRPAVAARSLSVS